MTGFARVSTPSRLIDQMDHILCSWWKKWRRGKLESYVPQSPKWTRTSAQPVIRDIVVFLWMENKLGFGESTWSVGRVLEVELSADGDTQSVVIQYKNTTEKVKHVSEKDGDLVFREH